MVPIRLRVFIAVRLYVPSARLRLILYNPAEAGAGQFAPWSADILPGPSYPYALSQLSALGRNLNSPFR